MEFVPRPENEQEQPIYRLMINLSNHPLESWGEAQIGTATSTFDELLDFPFPQIDPEWGYEEVQGLVEATTQAIIDVYNDKLDELPEDTDLKLFVHIMGEQSFTFNMVNELAGEGIYCICSTTRRNTVDMGGGKKISNFEFVRFRDYLSPATVDAASLDQEAFGANMQEMSGLLNDMMRQFGGSDAGLLEDDDEPQGPYFYDQDEEDQSK